MSYCLYRRSEVFFDNLAAALAGGRADFFLTGTDTPKDVYSDNTLATNLGSSVELNSAGRFDDTIWGSGSYRVRFYDADGVEVSEDDPISDPAGAASGIPSQTGHEGEALTTNGSVLAWVEYLSRLVPDPTGHADKLLTNDGSLLSWASSTDLGLPDYTDSGTTHDMTIGPYLIQFGNDTFPVPTLSPPHGATKALTFPKAFNAAPLCYGAWPNKITIASSGFRAVIATEATATSLTADFNTNENSTDPGGDVSVAIPFSWFAIGYAA